MPKEKCLFKGQWNKETAKPHGRGYMVLRSGDIIEGYFKDGQPFGNGRKITEECCINGFFVGFEMRADVTITFKDLSVFEGHL